MKDNKLKIIIGAAVLTGIIGALTFAAHSGKVMAAGTAGDITARDKKTVAAAGEEESADGAKETTGERIYCVGSVSKVYVTAAAMKLVDEGKIALNDPVTEYIPDFKMADERYKDITPNFQRF